MKKLSEKKIAQIRALRAKNPQLYTERKIAEKVGVSRSAVNYNLNNKK